MAILATIATIGTFLYICIGVIGVENILIFMLCALMVMIALGIFLLIFGEMIAGICLAIGVIYTFFKELFDKPKEEDNTLAQNTFKPKDSD